MILRPGSALSRALAGALLVGFFLLLWLVVAMPLLAWREGNIAGLAEARADLQRLEGSIGRLAAERAQLSGDTTAETVWTAARTGEVTALIQARVSELARQNGLALRSVTPTAGRKLPLTEAVGFRLEAEATLDQLLQFLIALEYHAPVLVIDSATLRRLARPGPASEQPSLFIQIDLVAPVLTTEADRT